MVRAPYTVRIAAGLIVTAIEETQKLPTLVVTLPMTALSEALQLGMRVQQGVAGLAIKGDLALELMFDRPSEEPSWARFDEDEDPVELSLIPAEQPGADALDDQPEPPAAQSPARESPAPDSPADDVATHHVPSHHVAAHDATAPEVTARQADAQPADAAPGTDRTTTTEPATGGRFALYSSAPDTVVKAPADTRPGAAAFDGPVPEVVEYIEYDRLTLAQLRAKLRSVGTDELAALLEYEQTTKARAPFVTMIENRITAQHKRHSTT